MSKYHNARRLAADDDSGPTGYDVSPGTNLRDYEDPNEPDDTDAVPAGRAHWLSEIEHAIKMLRRSSSNNHELHARYFSEIAEVAKRAASETQTAFRRVFHERLMLRKSPSVK